MTPEELVVGRRNLAAELRDELTGTNKVIGLDRKVVRDLIEVLDQPAPVQVEITDEAVKRGGWIIAEHRSQAWLTYSDETRAAIARSWESTARAVLEAARPLLGTRPQPTLDTEAAVVGILDSYGQGNRARAERIVDAVAKHGVVRPLPTREQIAGALTAAAVSTNHLGGAHFITGSDNDFADAVLDLFSGGEK